MHPRLTASLSLFLIAALHAQEPAEGNVGPSVGDVAPALSIREWIDGKTPLELGKGQACMLVFWAPWCGSCIAEFGRINSLVAATKDLPLTIVSLTSEARSTCEPLLAKRPLHSRIAIDRDRATFQAYGVTVLPRAMLIDGNGKVAAMPRIEDIDQAALERLANGKPVGLDSVRMLPCDLEWDEKKEGLDASASLSHAVIRRSTAASGGSRFPPSHGRITADGAPFSALLQLAFDAEWYQVVSTHPDYEHGEQRFQVSIKAPDDRPETARAMLREQLERLFAFRAEWVEVEEPTQVLARIAGTELKGLVPSTATEQEGSARRGRIQYTKSDMASIAQVLGSFGSGKEMLDETGLQGEFDFTLQWTHGDQESFAAALRSCGLEIRTEPRKVRRLKVQPKG
jgi:uncharacterized protein (TIGR03435 family)